MSDVGTIKSFLDTLEYEERKAAKGLDPAKGRYPFITISRAAGAGGHGLCDAIFEEMKKEKSPLFQGWHLFDKELCQMVCEEPGLKVSLHSLLKAEYRSEIEAMVTEMMVGDTPQDVVIKKIFNIIRNLATFGKVVLIGRGSTCLTRNLPLGIHVRLAASLPSRIQRMVRLMNMTEKEAREMIQEKDKSRQRLVKTFFNKDINDPLLYDAVWNADTVFVTAIARSLIVMIKQKAESYSLKV